MQSRTLPEILLSSLFLELKQVLSLTQRCFCVACFQLHLEFSNDGDISYASHCHLVARYLIAKREATCQGLQKHCFLSCCPIFQIVVIISTYKLLIALVLSFDPDMYLFTIARTERCQSCSAVSVRGLLSVKRVFNGTLQGCAAPPHKSRSAGWVYILLFCPI